MRIETRLPPPVPLRRVLPFATSHLGLVAGRLVRGRLRVIWTSLSVSHDDYLDLCEAAWQTTLTEKLIEARLQPQRRPPELEPPRRDRPEPRAENPRRVKSRSRVTSKPIQDGPSGPLGDRLRRGLGRLLARLRP